jgi:heterodisulfide reductase subunit A-like polyferredoxin/coenzyme F420-reducing hydrogenase delta subunit
MENISMNTDVLVIGGNLTGDGTALALAAAGYRVLLAKQSSKGDDQPAALLGVSEDTLAEWQKMSGRAASNKHIEMLNNVRLVRAAGVCGDFTVRLAGGDGGCSEKKVGAIVVATDLKTDSLHQEYGLELSGNVLSLSQAEGRIAGGGIRGKSVGFLVGLKQNSDPITMKRIFKAVLSIVDGGGSASVYVNEIKLADNGLDRLYKEGRDKGAVYFKMKQAPEISGTSISFHDVVLGKPVEATHDLLVVEEKNHTDETNAPLAEALGLHITPSGFLQKDNVHRFPVKSNRKGIFVTGGARQTQNLTGCVTDVAGVVQELRSLFAAEVPSDRIAVVDREKCAICLTCYRCCPHGAIYWEDKAVVSPVACQGCGICASECPNDAIQLVSFTDDEIISEIKNTVKKTPGAIIAFCCENSAAEAAESAGRFGMALPETLSIIKVPCAGKVDIQYILSAFVEGAGGVLVAACHNGNCKSEYGSSYAKWRVNEVARMLDETGVEKNRLAFVTMASNMASDFVKAACALAGKGSGN